MKKVLLTLSVLFLIGCSEDSNEQDCSCHMVTDYEQVTNENGYTYWLYTSQNECENFTRTIDSSGDVPRWDVGTCLPSNAYY